MYDFCDCDCWNLDIGQKRIFRRVLRGVLSSYSHSVRFVPEIYVIKYSDFLHILCIPFHFWLKTGEITILMEKQHNFGNELISSSEDFRVGLLPQIVIPTRLTPFLKFRIVRRLLWRCHVIVVSANVRTVALYIISGATTLITKEGWGMDDPH